MGSLRQFGGISGFCKRSESIYDAFGAGKRGRFLLSAPSESGLEFGFTGVDGP